MGGRDHTFNLLSIEHVRITDNWSYLRGFHHPSPWPISPLSWAAGVDLAGMRGCAEDSTGPLGCKGARVLTGWEGTKMSFSSCSTAITSRLSHLSRRWQVHVRREDTPVTTSRVRETWGGPRNQGPKKRRSHQASPQSKKDPVTGTFIQGICFLEYYCQMLWEWVT